MLKVRISVGGNELVSLYAVRVRGQPHELCDYDVFEEKGPNEEDRKLGHIKHNYDDGGIELGQKMLTRYIDWERAKAGNH